MIRRHAEAGNPQAIRHLGHAYKHGEFGLVPSHKKAARLWQRAADLGDLNATFNVGSTYLKGEGRSAASRLAARGVAVSRPTGVKLDKRKAVRYWRVAADRGLSRAQFNLGLCFRRGDGIAVDDAEAVRLWTLAAAQGDVLAGARRSFRRPPTRPRLGRSTPRASSASSTRAAAASRPTWARRDAGGSARPPRGTRPPRSSSPATRTSRPRNSSTAA